MSWATTITASGAVQYRSSVLYIWSPADKAWAPLIVCVSARGSRALHGVRAQLTDLGFATTSGFGFNPDDQALIDRIAGELPPPRIAQLFDEPGSFSPGCLNVDRRSTGIPVLYVWADLRGSWKPLLVGVTPFGRKAVHALAGHLAGAGFPVFVSAVPADNSEAILRLAVLIPPPAGAPFVDHYADGVIDIGSHHAS